MALSHLSARVWRGPSDVARISHCLLLFTCAVSVVRAQAPPADAPQITTQVETQVTTQTTPQITTQISPQAAYDDALRPVEITHRSIENWSDIETTALAVTIREARDACNARAPGSFSGEDLIALARLCALGQQWPSVLEAASRYIGQPNTPQPQLAEAFADQIGAALHLNDAETALTASHKMLERVPYGVLAQQATSETVRYLQLIRTSEALSLLEFRQPLLLARLRALSTPSSDLTVRALYIEGLALPALQQFSHQDAAATAAKSNLDAALPADFGPDDALPIAAAQRQYAILGHLLPPIAAAASLFSPTETPRINTEFGSSTVLVLFPDWCAQCVRMGQQFMPTLFRLGEQDVHLYGLLAQATPPPTPAPPAAQRGHPQHGPHAAGNSSQAARTAARDAAPSSPMSAADLLRGTPTLVVSPHLLDAFGATDFPLLAITDHRGIVRFLQVAPENAFVAGGLVDQVTARIAADWPPPAPPATTSATP